MTFVRDCRIINAFGLDSGKGESLVHHLYYLMGKSASGKDTVYKRLLERFPALKPLILHTTRPQRDKEQNGRE